MKGLVGRLFSCVVLLVKSLHIECTDGQMPAYLDLYLTTKSSADVYYITRFLKNNNCYLTKEGFEFFNFLINKGYTYIDYYNELDNGSMKRVYIAVPTKELDNIVTNHTYDSIPVFDAYSGKVDYNFSNIRLKFSNQGYNIAKFGNNVIFLRKNSKEYFGFFADENMNINGQPKYFFWGASIGYASRSLNVNNLKKCINDYEVANRIGAKPVVTKPAVKPPVTGPNQPKPVESNTANSGSSSGSSSPKKKKCCCCR